jgi:hypothetical protein
VLGSHGQHGSLPLTEVHGHGRLANTASFEGWFDTWYILEGQMSVRGGDDQPNCVAGDGVWTSPCGATRARGSLPSVPPGVAAVGAAYVSADLPCPVRGSDVEKAKSVSS